MIFDDIFDIIFVKKFSCLIKKSSPSPLWGHRLPATALALSARGLDKRHVLYFLPVNKIETRKVFLIKLELV